jgi:long-chain acyl-CoA synthetase
MPRSNLISVFDAFLEHGAGPAVVETQGYRRQSRTYRELHGLALSVSGALARHQVGPGDRVLLWGANSARWIAGFWGVQLSGAIAVPMDAGASPDFVRRTLEESGAKLILRDRNQPEVAIGPPSLVLEEFEEAPSADARVPAGRSAATRQSIAEILFTSGTTAEPRGVVLRHGNFLANLEPIERGLEAYRKYERLLHPLRLVSLVPLSHVFGQFLGMFVPPLLGAVVVFQNSANPSEILRSIPSERATGVIAVPRMLDLLRRAIEREIDARGWRRWFEKNYAAAAGQPFLRRAWRFRRIHRLFGFRFWAFISGGASLASETEQFWKRLGFAVVQGYGMTETASLVSLNHPFSATEGSIGKVLPGREFKLAEDGEILVRGESVSSGYWERQGLAPAENSGWLRTGDLGELDGEGNLKFRGRKKNVIVTAAGLNIYPEDLEAAIRKQPAVRDSVVVPVERDGNAEACAVLLLDRPAADDQAASAVAAANRGLAGYQQIRRWVVWPDPDFPRTATGKPRLGLIAGRALELAGRGGSGPSPAEGDPLASLAGGLENLSSLDRVELLSALEQRYQVQLDEAAFSEAKTVADLRRQIGRAAPPEARYRYPRWAQSEAVRAVRLLVYYALVWPATWILARPRVLGRGRLEGLEGPVVVVSNHITRRADIGLVLAALPARFRHRLATAMGGESLARMRIPPREWLFLKRWAYRTGYWLVTALFNVFPLPQFSGFRESFRFAGESSDRGYSVLIFPEGQVNDSPDGRMAPFRSGVGLLAVNLALPVVPLRLDGVAKMKSEGRRLAHPGEITVRIGTPLRFSAGTPPEEIARRLEAAVLAL